MLVVPITEDRVARLRTFGLSEYAARAYLALLDLGLTEARDVSTLSKVPTSKIYRILEQLHEKGLAIILPEFPKKYAPVPFNEYLDKLQEQHEDAIKSIDRDRDQLAEMFSVSGDVDVGDRGSFTVIRGRRNVLAKIQELMSETRFELLFVGTQGTVERSKYYVDELRRAHQRDVRVRLLLPSSVTRGPQLDTLSGIAEVREHTPEDTQDAWNVAIGIFDDASAFIVNFVPDDGHLYQGKDTGFFTDHEAMVSALKTILEPHWSRAFPSSGTAPPADGDATPPFTHYLVDDAGAIAALREAVDRGAGALRLSEPAPAPAPTRAFKDVVARVAAQDGTVRLLLGTRDPAVTDAYAAVLADVPGAELRCTDASGDPRFWVADGREALFSVIAPRPTTPGDTRHLLMVHTSNPASVHAMHAHFDALWAAAAPKDGRKSLVPDSPAERRV